MKLSLFSILWTVLALTAPTAVISRPVNIEEGKNQGSASRFLAGFLDPFGPGWTSCLTYWGLGPPVTPTKVKVNIVGLGRTGTTSMAVAMEILGYKVLHDEENARTYDVYRDYYAGKMDEDELHVALGNKGYNATFRTNTYEWAGKQEDVKVILTTRDNPDKWVDSWIIVAYFWDLLKAPPFSWLPTANGLRPLRFDLIKNIPTGGHPDEYMNPKVLRKGYDIHLENVRNSVPKERLLEFNVKEGWEPLCKFLELPIPDMPFPHVNDKVKIRGMIFCYEVITFIFMFWPLYCMAFVSWLSSKITKSYIVVEKVEKKRPKTL